MFIFLEVFIYSSLISNVKDLKKTEYTKKQRKHLKAKQKWCRDVWDKIVVFTENRIYFVFPGS